MSKFRVAVSSDNLRQDGKPAYGDEPLKLLSHPAIEWEWLSRGAAEITAEQAQRFDAVVVGLQKVTAKTFSGANQRLKLVARLGVGYDTIDVAACTEHGVILSITPDGVRRPVATNALTFMLALGQQLFAKDRITRAGQWQERLNCMGTGLTGKSLGVIGVGNIGAELFRLARPLDMVFLGCDPVVSQEAMASLGAKRVDLGTLLRQADFISVHCPLRDDTRTLIGAAEFALMKPTAFFINTARGPIVDEKALYEALAARRIAGAAIDVFEEEPTPADNPILKLDNVIVTPHHFCYTEECARGIASSAFESVAALAQRRLPKHMVNGAVRDHAALKTWLQQAA